MTKTERQMLKELASQISALVTGISKASQSDASLVLLSGIRKGLLKVVTCEELTLPLFPEEETK